MAHSRRISREKQTVRAMIEMYCHARHETKHGVCEDCQALHDYAMRRIDRCPFSPAKPVCAKCKIHCYNKEMREKIRKVMRFAGPKMMIHHPVLAMLHALDGLRRR